VVRQKNAAILVGRPVGVDDSLRHAKVCGCTHECQVHLIDQHVSLVEG
jgi:hypothetical protein